MSAWSLAIAGAAAALVSAGCFSERSLGPGNPTDGQCTLPLSAKVPGSRLVLVRSFAFQPGDVRVKAGETVTWVNCAAADEPAHTTTDDGGAFASPLLAPGEAFSQTFSQPGTFTYHCEPHPFMTARILVDP